MNEDSNKYRNVSDDHKLCMTCQYNEDVQSERVYVKVLCERHNKIVDIYDEACPDYMK